MKYVLLMLFLLSCGGKQSTPEEIATMRASFRPASVVSEPEAYDSDLITSKRTGAFAKHTQIGITDSTVSIYYGGSKLQLVRARDSSNVFLEFNPYSNSVRFRKVTIAPRQITVDSIIYLLK